MADRVLCAGKGTLNIHQESLNGVCRHVSTSGNLPVLFSYSSKETLVENKCMEHSVEHSAVRAYEQLNKACLADS